MEATKKRTRSESPEGRRSTSGVADFQVQSDSRADEMDWSVDETVMISPLRRKFGGNTVNPYNSSKMVPMEEFTDLQKKFHFIMEDKDLFMEVLQHADFPSQRRWKR